MWLSGKESACNPGDNRFYPWVRKISWRGKWQPIPVFLPGRAHSQRSLAGYSPNGSKELDTTKRLNTASQTIKCPWEESLAYPFMLLCEQIYLIFSEKREEAGVSESREGKPEGPQTSSSVSQTWWAPKREGH